jgi:hypothetical protein
VGSSSAATGSIAPHPVRTYNWDKHEPSYIGDILEMANPPVPLLGARSIVYETIIDDDRSKNASGLLMSLNMCMGGMKDAGFSGTRAEHLIGPDWMVLGVKYPVAHPCPNACVGPGSFTRVEGELT